MQVSVSFVSKTLPAMLLLLLHAGASTIAATAGCGGTFTSVGVISPPPVPTPTLPSRSTARGSSGSSGSSGPWGASGSDGGRGGSDGGRGGSDGGRGGSDGGRGGSDGGRGGSGVNAGNGNGGNAGNGNGGNAGSTGTTCTWNLVALKGRSVDIRFSAMQLLKNHDSLSVYSGDLLVATFTGSSLPPNMTLGSTARLVFRSDDAIKTRTFTAVFMSRVPLCGGLLVVSDRATSSVITSPNYPDLYPNNVDCTWTIVSPTTGKTRVQFTVVELEDYNRDRLVVFDGSDVVLRCTGIMKPELLNLGRTVFIRFTSNASVQKRGFRAVINGPSTPYGGTGSWRS